MSDLAHRELVNTRSIAWKKRNPEKRRASDKRYRDKNKEKHNADMREYRRLKKINRLHDERMAYALPPLLPVEFARQSRDGRITLVIVEGFAPVPRLWSAFKTRDLARARESLRQREGVFRSRADDFIAYWRRGENPASETDATISAWTAGNNLDAAVWTNLPPKFDGIDGRVPTETDVIAYLQSLEGETRAAAEEYVRRAPQQIATAYRRAIERALGWTPID